MYNEQTDYPRISGMFRKRDVILCIIQPFRNRFSKLWRCELQGRKTWGHSDHDFECLFWF